MNNLFIGRENDISFFKETYPIFVLHPENGYSISLQGPNDIGKTTLIKKLSEEFKYTKPDNSFYFYVSLGTQRTYKDFWKDIIKKMSKSINADILKKYDKDDLHTQEILDVYNFFNGECDSSEIPGQLDNIFEELKELNIYIILVIDEFDKAKECFLEGTEDGDLFFNGLFNLSQKGGEPPFMSIILISRKRVQLIAHSMHEGSDFKSAFETHTLKGFSNKDLNEYYDSYTDLGITLTDEQKREIIYICGRHPGLLMKMRVLVKTYCHNSKFSPISLYKAHPDNIDNVYERIITHLKKERIDYDDENSSNFINTFYQAFIGPAYDEKLNVHLKELMKCGIINEFIDDHNNIFLLCGQSEDSYPKFKYEPISPFFIEYFKLHVSPDELEGLIKILFKTEKKVRSALREILKQSYGEEWEQKIEEYYKDKREKNFMTSLAKKAFSNNASLRGVEYSFLDVLGFTQYGNIIKTNWNKARTYFKSYEKIDELVRDFEFINDCRNLICHSNAEIMNDKNRSKLAGICKTVMADIDAKMKNTDDI